MPKSKSARGGPGLHPITDKVTLAKAFQLAHSLYRFRMRDRHIALKIVSEALSGVQVRVVAQDEADRHDPQKPTKVRWSTKQWLQLLVYCKSEAFERQQETDQRASLSREDMIIRYIKHLIVTTSRRNSFHISLGLSRLLYDYSAADTMAIYDLVFQDPDTSTRKSDAYYRSRKNKLLEELARRFEQFVRIEQGLRGEKRFQSESDSSRFTELVVEYLTLFTPWDTSCKLPAQMDAWTPVHSLRSSQPSQIHALIHPTCFQRITQSLKLDSPAKRLSLPDFFLNKTHSDEKLPPDDNSPLSELTSDEANAIRERLADLEDRRKKFMPRSLRVLADGIECARLSLAESDQVRFDIEDDITLIEVIGRNDAEELLLATHIRTHDEDDTASQSLEHSIILGGGQRISFTILTAPSVDENRSTASVEIKYQETKVVRAFRLWWRQLSRPAFETGIGQRWGRIPIAAAALLLMIVTGLILYSLLGSNPDQPGDLAQQRRTSSEPEGGKVPTPGSTAFPQAVATPSTVPPGKTEPSPRSVPSPSGNTREQGERAVKSLLGIERLYVESLGNDAFGRALHQRITEGFTRMNRFAVAGNKNEADTAMIGVARAEGMRKDASSGQEIEVGSVTLQVVNVYGEPIWSGKFRGTADQIASQLIRDLSQAIERERRP